jgi:hypothetical protein
VCLLANRFTDIKGKLNDLGKVAQAAGLHLNKSKTKEMRVHSITDTRLQLGEEEIEEVKEFVYLGSIISKRGGSDEDITARIKKAKASFSQLSPIWKSKQMSLNTKIRFLIIIIMLNLFYFMGVKHGKRSGQIAKLCKQVLEIHFGNMVTKYDM